MPLTPKTNIPSLFEETNVGLTPRADYHVRNDRASAHVHVAHSARLNEVVVPETTLQRTKQVINDPANKGVNS